MLRCAGTDRLLKQARSPKAVRRSRPRTFSYSARATTLRNMIASCREIKLSTGGDTPAAPIATALDALFM